MKIVLTGFKKKIRYQRRDIQAGKIFRMPIDDYIEMDKRYPDVLCNITPKLLTVSITHAIKSMRIKL